MPDHRRDRAMQRVYQSMAAAMRVLELTNGDIKELVSGQPSFDDGVLAAGAAIQDALSKLGAAQAKLTYSIKNNLEDLAVAWCGHTFPKGKHMTCGCGPAPM